MELSTSITGLDSCVCLTVFGTQVCGIRVHLALTNLLKTPPVGTKPTPDGARQIGSRCGPAKPRPRFSSAAAKPPNSQRGRATNAAPQRKHAHTDAVPHGKPAPGALPHGKKKQQHRTMLLLQTNLLITLPHGKVFGERRTRSRT